MSSLNTSHDDIHHEKPYTQHINTGPDLSRQITLQLNADQYERLFFQPTSAKGDLAKRLGRFPILQWYSKDQLFNSNATPTLKPHIR